MPSTQCELAPLVCLQNYCTETTNDPAPGWSGFCGNNTSVHNPQYYQFIAVAEEVEIHIHVDFCYSGTALQSALIANCPWEVFDVLDCDPGTPPGGTMVLEADGLIPGFTYWLLIDGSSGGVCAYTITYVEGVYEPELFGELSSVEIVTNDSVFIPGDYVWLETGPEVGNAHGYYWVLGWNGDTVTSSYIETQIQIPCDLDPGIFEICVGAFSGCDTTENEVCLIIEVEESTNIFEKEPATFCPEEFPFIWQNIVITGPGTYTRQFGWPYPCVRDSVWQVNAYPEVPVGQLDTLVCDVEFYYEGISYDASGMYELVYPGGSENGCDSTSELHLTLHALEAFVEAPCTDTSVTLISNIVFHSNGGDSIQYAWYDCSFDTLLSTAKDFPLDSSGCFCLVLDHAFCPDTICSSYEANPCATFCSLVQDTACVFTPVEFKLTDSIQENASLHWLIDVPGKQEEYFADQPIVHITYDTTGWKHVSLTVVDSISTYTCVDSVYIAESVSSASLCCDRTTCDSCTTLNISLQGASPFTVQIFTAEDSITYSGILDPLFQVQVCPPIGSPVQYWIHVTDSTNTCPVTIDGLDTVTIQHFPEPVITIDQEVDTLCTDLIDGWLYHWFTCETAESLGFNNCYTPSQSGCYCVEILTDIGCRDTACYDFIISSTAESTADDILLYPIPTAGGIWIELPSHVELPVRWQLYDYLGKDASAGIISSQKQRLEFAASVEPGIYIMQFVLENGKQVITRKILLL